MFILRQSIWYNYNTKLKNQNYDDPILRKRCKEVKVGNDKIRLILNDMLDTLQHTENGAALAANQVGILKRLVVIDYDGCCLKLVNPSTVG